MLSLRRILVFILLLAGLWGGVTLSAQTAVPPAPTRWVTDAPGLLSAAVRENLDRQLEAYQKGTGHQVLLWIGGTTGGDPLEDWTVRAFAAWKVGRAGLDDGLVLFVFTGDRKLRIEVGYGLEGQVPDAVASRIIRETIVPGFQAGDPDGALTAGVARILKVVGGDAAAAQPQDPGQRGGPLPPMSLGAKILLAVLGLGVLVLVITHPGLAVWLLFSLLSGGRGGGGGFGGGGGGGWSGGGGRGGGGGASGSW